MKHTSVLLAVCWFVMSCGTASGCPPSWYNTLQGIGISLLSPEQLCGVKRFISTCNPDSTASCNSGDTSYMCCPFTYFPIVDHCYTSNTRGLCVPQTLTAEQITAIISDLNSTG